MNINKISAFFVALMILATNSHAYNSTVALEFIKGKQLPNGAFDSYSSPHSPSAVLALYEAEGSSEAVNSGLAFLKSDLENNMSYSWGEADIPGFSLFVYGKAGNLSNLDLGGTSSRLLNLQGPNGGFKGYFQCTANCSDWQNWSPIEDSISTAAALMGLTFANATNETIRTGAINYLQTLRNPDGSYNLTSNIVAGDLWSFAPDVYSQTAFVLWGLYGAGVQETDVSNSLNFLQDGIMSNFSNNNRTYAPSLASIVLAAYNRQNSSTNALQSLNCLQHPDGGYADPGRMGSASNVMDTAFAIIAIGNYSFTAGCYSTNSTNSTPSPSASPSASPSPSPSASPSASPSPTSTATPTTQQSGSNQNNYYATPTPTPLPKKATPKPTSPSSPTPAINNKMVKIATETPAPALKPTETVKKQEAETTIAATAAPTMQVSSGATGLFSAGNVNFVYAGIIILILIGAYTGIRFGAFK